MAEKNKILKEEPIIEKIAELKSKLYGADSGDLSIVDEWNKQVKTALITDNLQQHEGVKMIIDKVNEDIAEINDVLQTAKSSELPDVDRDRMLDIKKFYQWFLDLFTTARSQIDEISKSVDNELQP
jgi:hypothetical protein